MSREATADNSWISSRLISLRAYFLVSFRASHPCISALRLMRAELRHQEETEVRETWMRDQSLRLWKDSAFQSMSPKLHSRFPHSSFHGEERGNKEICFWRKEEWFPLKHHAAADHSWISCQSALTAGCICTQVHRADINKDTVPSVRAAVFSV